MKNLDSIWVRLPQPHPGLLQQVALQFGSLLLRMRAGLGAFVVRATLSSEWGCTFVVLSLRLLVCISVLAHGATEGARARWAFEIMPSQWCVRTQLCEQGPRGGRAPTLSDDCGAWERFAA